MPVPRSHHAFACIEHPHQPRRYHPERADGLQLAVRRCASTAMTFPVYPASVPVLTLVSCCSTFVYECQNQRDTSARFPKFVRHRGKLSYELRKAKGTSKDMILVRFWI